MADKNDEHYEVQVWWDTLVTEKEREAQRRYVEDAILAQQQGKPVPDDVKLMVGRAEAPGVHGYEIFPAWLVAILDSLGFERDQFNILFILKCTDEKTARTALRGLWNMLDTMAHDPSEGETVTLPATKPTEPSVLTVTAAQVAEAIPHLRTQICLPFRQMLAEL